VQCAFSSYKLPFKDSYLYIVDKIFCMRLVKLNEDSSWMWEWDGIRVLVDPWFTPSQIDYHPAFSEQFHLTAQPKVSDLGKIDYIFISHPFTDHCNKETLLQIDKDIPVISRPGILKKISRWNHFNVLIPMEEAPFKISVIPTNSLFDPVHFAFRIENEDGTFIYAPHGTKAKNLPKADVLITTTTTFELPFWLGGTINLGYKKALRAKELSGASILVATHDEKKSGKGFVEKLAKKTYESQLKDVRVLRQGEDLVFHR
jgi:L-ascorbate metabolism protein UlaG (beta-lactamase superfamily)